MNKATIISIAAAGLLAAGCGEPPAPEDIVAERAQARWDAQVAGDVRASYELRTPGYREQNELTDHAVMLSRKKISYEGATVQEVDCEAERCNVKVLVAYRADGAPGVMNGMEGERPINEIWVRIDGQWWYAGPA